MKTTRIGCRVLAGGALWLLATGNLVLAQTDPQQIYATTCVACHAVDGKGALPGVTDLSDPNGPLSKPDAVLISNIDQGFQGPNSPMAMPPRGGNPDLQPEQIPGLIKYMREQFLKPSCTGSGSALHANRYEQ